jgi:hypothetical protein
MIRNPRDYYPPLVMIAGVLLSLGAVALGCVLIYFMPGS